MTPDDAAKLIMSAGLIQPDGAAVAAMAQNGAGKIGTGRLSQP